eukprot:1342473-Pleurochrysis_carterae.AAC.1
MRTGPQRNVYSDDDAPPSLSWRPTYCHRRRHPSSYTCTAAQHVTTRLVAGGLHVVHIYYERGEIGHDLARDDLAERAIALAANPPRRSHAFTAACSTWLAARFEQGTPQVLRTIEYTQWA